MAERKFVKVIPWIASSKSSDQKYALVVFSMFENTLVKFKAVTLIYNKVITQHGEITNKPIL
jgi:hypothetical protein